MGVPHIDLCAHRTLQPILVIGRAGPILEAHRNGASPVRRTSSATTRVPLVGDLPVFRAGLHEDLVGSLLYPFAAKDVAFDNHPGLGHGHRGKPQLELPEPAHLTVLGGFAFQNSQRQRLRRRRMREQLPRGVWVD